MRLMAESRTVPVRRHAIVASCLYTAATALVAAALLVTTACREARSAAAAADTAPVRIALGWAGDPATSQAVTWRTADAAPTPW